MELAIYVFMAYIKSVHVGLNCLVTIKLMELWTFTSLRYKGSKGRSFNKFPEIQKSLLELKQVLKYETWLVPQCIIMHYTAHVATI